MTRYKGIETGNTENNRFFGVELLTRFKGIETFFFVRKICFA